MVRLDKGQQLEQVVRLIEYAIITQDPQLAKAEFEIIPRLIVKVAGVRHEIDVAVRVNKGSSYETLHIFECKNWKAKVGKNEVIQFSEKVKVTGAHRGYIVARSWTSDAAAQARLDPRLALMKCADSFDESLMGVSSVAYQSSLVTTTVNIQFRAPNNSGQKVLLQVDTACELEGTRMAFREFAAAKAHEIFDAHLKQSTWLKLEGMHTKRVAGTIRFDPGKCTIDGKDVEFVSIVADFKLDVFIPRVTSRYEVATRGRVCVYQIKGMLVPEGAPPFEFFVTAALPKEKTLKAKR